MHERRPRPVRRAACLALALLQLWPAVALASEPQSVEQARALIEEGEFERAVKAIDLALGRPDVGSATAARLYELQGVAWLYLGKDPQARESFENLLRLNRGYQLAKGSSSKAKALLDEIRARFAPQLPAARPVTVEALPAAGRAGQPLELRAEVRELPAGARPKAYWRGPGAARFSSAPLTEAGPGRWTAQVPGFDVPAGERGVLEYYLEVADAEGLRLGGAGSAERPLALSVAGEPRAPAQQSATPAPPPPAEEIAEPWYRKWWVWTIAGGLAVGAGAAVAYPLVTGQRAQVPITIQVQQ